MFHLQQHNTTVRTEFIAGLTTFLTMLYIVPVNGYILSAAGLPMEAVITATALITILATLMNGLWSNTPIAMSVGMGLNAYFAYGLVLGMQIPWQTALGVVFLSGVLFIILSFTPFRAWIMYSIPIDLRRAISAGIGGFIAFIGLEQMGVIANSDATLVTLGDFSSPTVLLGIFGFFVALVLYAYKVTGAFVFSIVITSIVGWTVGLAEVPKTLFSWPASIEPIAFELDIVSAFSLSLLPVILIFLITTMFDTLGSLTGIGTRAHLFQEQTKNDASLEKTLKTDAIATAGSSLLGVTPIAAFIESAAGVEQGGRTGLTAVVTAGLFVLTLFMLPLFQALPENAIYPILVIVGILMFGELRKVAFQEQDLATNAAIFLIVLLMPLTYSITTGIAAGFLVYVALKLVKREFADLNLGIFIIALISGLTFVL
ncbi:NCS2 family permease [Hydrogenovibrio thermophilus]|uniref:NCS2 family permease n=1 Tax=Hydrogenovibrio thermophilus TaxID=265883 RepID=A0A451G563_9GAMM|nr:NCS2 family permease [Hydrogenovibrio thermophilus]QAB14638.1 NCS2 family permease [Hydrogenovibrio thermophilus]